LRILIVSQFFWPENFRINDLAAELVARGHEVTVLTGAPNYPEGRIHPEFRRKPRAFDTYRGVKVVRVPIVVRGSTRIQLAINYVAYAVSAASIGAWKLRGQAFDRVFVFACSPITVALPGMVIGALKKAPMAMWVLDLWPHTLEALGVLRSKYLLGLVGKMVSFFYGGCDLILAQSRSFIPEIVKYCRRDIDVEFFPNWAESIFENTTAAAPAAEVPTQLGAFNVMFAGNIGECQDFPSVLAAAELLKDRPHIRWLVVGDGRMADWVKAEIGKRGLEHCVLLLGRYPLERMPSFYQHADALLVSLRDEANFAMTIPGKLQSYLAAGIPVLGMLNGEGAAVINQSGGGLTCGASDPQGLAAAVTTLAAMSREERREMGARALRYSLAEFDRSMLIARLERWLNGLRRTRATRSAPDSAQASRD
jgi:glycosyltransferase involved in cell wall biosynthesis